MHYNYNRWYQLRYYDPDLCRFISPDRTKYLEPETLGGLNLYAYCNNNPVMYADPSGHFLITAVLVSALIGGAISFLGTYLSTPKNDENRLLKSIVSGVAGALSGALCAALPGASLFIDMGLSVAESITNNIISGENIAVIASGIVTSALFSAFSGGTGIMGKTETYSAIRTIKNSAKDFLTSSRKSIKKAGGKTFKREVKKLLKVASSELVETSITDALQFGTDIYMSNYWKYMLGES